MESFSKSPVPSHPGKKGEIVGERCGSEVQTAFKKANCLPVVKQGVESQVYRRRQKSECARTGSREMGSWESLSWLPRTLGTLATGQVFLLLSLCRGRSQTLEGGFVWEEHFVVFYFIYFFLFLFF